MDELRQKLLKLVSNPDFQQAMATIQASSEDMPTADADMEALFRAMMTVDSFAREGMEVLRPIRMNQHFDYLNLDA